MANEVTVRNSLIVKSGKLDYSSKPTSFIGNATTARGATPGGFLAAAAPGTDVDLSELTTPGYCWIMNCDSTNYVEVGIYDPETVFFYPLLELLPGECAVVRLSRNLSAEYGTGLGTIGGSTNTLRVRANTAACWVIVDAFEA